MRLALFAVVAGVGACSLWSDFDGLDDARPDAGGAGGAAGGSQATGATGATAGDGGSGAGGGGGAGAIGGAAGPGGAGGGDGGHGGDGGAPACKEAVEPCMNKAECCGNLACGDTSAGHVCCGLTGEPCTKPGGEDCCGWVSECEDGFCT
jgi:hypothetical protein